MISLPVRRLVGFTSVTVIALASGNAFAAAPIPTTFNPTVIQAMQALRGKTDLDLNAPTLLPNRQTGFLTAVTQASVGPTGSRLSIRSAPCTLIIGGLATI